MKRTDGRIQDGKIRKFVEIRFQITNGREGKEIQLEMTEFLDERARNEIETSMAKKGNTCTVGYIAKERRGRVTSYKYASRNWCRFISNQSTRTNESQVIDFNGLGQCSSDSGPISVHAVICDRPDGFMACQGPSPSFKFISI